MKFAHRLSRAWQADNIILHLSLIGLTTLVVWGATCGLWGLNGTDETRYTQIAKNLIDNGDIFLLTINNQPYDQKPPLVFWLFALALKLCGGEVNSFAPRIVSVLFALMTLFCTYLCGRRLVNAKTGLYGAFILATFPVFMNYAPKAKLDMIFAALITLSITALATRKTDELVSWPRALIIWGGLAGAFFAKGPLALVIVLIFIVLDAGMHGKAWRQNLRHVRFLEGLSFVLLLIGIWLGIEVYLAGPSFVTNQVGSETVERVIHGAHKNSVWFYFTHIFAIIGVWVFALVLAFFALIKRKVPPMPHLQIWLCWFLPGFILLCLASGKRVSYPLLLLPPLALFIGYYINALSLNATHNKLTRLTGLTINGIYLLAGMSLCAISVILYIKLSIAWNYAFYVTRPALMLAFLIGLVFLITGLRQWRKRPGLGKLCVMTILAALLTNFLMNTVIYPALDVHNTARYFSQNLTLMYPELLKTPLGVIAGSNDGTSVSRVDGPRFHLYGKYSQQPVLFNREMFAAYDTTLPEYILMQEKDLRQLTTAPETADFRLVFWDLVEDKYMLVLLHRRSMSQSITDTAKVLLLADSLHESAFTTNDEGLVDLNREKCFLPAGRVLYNDSLQSYQSKCNIPNKALLDVYRLAPDLTDIYTLNMQKGLKSNIYAFNWLLQQGAKYPTEGNILVLANLSANFEQIVANNRAFYKWALNKLVKKTQVKVIFLTGAGGRNIGAEALEGFKIKPNDMDTPIIKLWLDFATQPTTLRISYGNSTAKSLLWDDIQLTNKIQYRLLNSLFYSLMRW